MKNHKVPFVVFLVVAFVCLSIQGASVLLNGFGLSSVENANGGITYNLEWYNEDHWPSILFDTTYQKNQTTLSPVGALCNFTGIWMETTIGDIVDEAAFKNGTVFADLMLNPTHERNDIVVNGNKDLYLGVIVYSFYWDQSTLQYVEVDPYYGWVGLNVNKGVLTLLGSYLDLDGNPVIAGQYLSVEQDTPEPAGGLLLLLGTGILLLRRGRARGTGRGTVAGGRDIV